MGKGVPFEDEGDSLFLAGLEENFFETL
jgi:hypothetical protein